MVCLIRAGVTRLVRLFEFVAGAFGELVRLFEFVAGALGELVRLFEFVAVRLAGRGLACQIRNCCTFCRISGGWTG
ncbi:hypothetical protein PBOR_09245 [Paenibacillus borealis]|uniref:Uncharacterized protein n=1 Tax=Paenibacillus borealis TaxID=160799 RepID=A0A089MKK7_PAEBO|nr:hypothetical protein PBOR_09245 [Paenibacillus borealis]